MSDFAEVPNDLLKEDFIIACEEDPLFRASDNYPFYLIFIILSHPISTSNSENHKYLHSPPGEYSAKFAAYGQKTGKLILSMHNNSELQINPNTIPSP